jgi:hypothetical protein
LAVSNGVASSYLVCEVFYARLLGWPVLRFPIRTPSWRSGNKPRKKETYMSKNLTRKGLAFGAIVALGTTLFAGAPAQAAAAITAAPSVGTGTTVLASDTFVTKVYGNIDFAIGSSTNLRWKITKPSSTATATYAAQTGSVTTAAYSTSTVDYVIPDTKVDTAGGNTISINPSITSSGASQDWIVQPYIEVDGGDGIGATDLAGNSLTIHFVKALVPVVTLDAVSDSLAVTGTVKFSNTDFNYAQSTPGSTHIWIDKNAVGFNDRGAVTLNDTKDGFEFSVSADSVAVGNVIAAKAKASGDDSGTLTSSEVVYSTADSASNAAAQTTTISKSVDITGGSSAYSVRTGTKSFTYRVDFFKEAGKVNAVAAGKPVRLTVTEGTSTIATNDVIRVNGKKLTGDAAATQSAVLNTVTDATGGITVTVESELALSGDVITIDVLATGSALAAESDTFTWTDAKLDSVSLTNGQLGGDGSNGAYAPTSLTVVKGAAVTLKYALRDQFGKLWAPTGKNYRLAVVASGGTLALNTNVDFADGEATLTYTDNSTDATQATSIAATLKSKLAADTAYSTTLTTVDSTTTLSAGGSVTTELNVVSSAQVASKITLNAAADNASAQVSDADGVAHATNKVTKSNATLKALDLRSNANGSGLSNSYGAKISGVVYQATGATAQGASVTISAPGLFFATDLAGTKYVSADSITVNTTETTGAFAVWALSKKGGTFAVSITSGSVTKTQNIKWAAAAATDGKNITITAPTSSLPGRAVDVVVLLTDKYGAPVQTTTTGNERLSVAITGPGSNTTIAATTDADGKISFKLIFGAYDTGVATIKVTYDADGDTTTYSPVVVSQGIAVGQPEAAARLAASTKKFYVGIDNAKGLKVVVKVAGKTVKSFVASLTKQTVSIASAKGKKAVKVYVDGDLQVSKTLTIK